MQQFALVRKSGMEQDRHAGFAQPVRNREYLTIDQSHIENGAGR